MLLEKYPSSFSTDFEVNKKAIQDLTTLKSKPLRNKIAGYITKIMMKREVS
jgi:small subunit ribosomal protein S17e